MKTNHIEIKKLDVYGDTSLLVIATNDVEWVEGIVFGMEEKYANKVLHSLGLEPIDDEVLFPVMLEHAQKDEEMRAKAALRRRPRDWSKVQSSFQTTVALISTSWPGPYRLFNGQSISTILTPMRPSCLWKWQLSLAKGLASIVLGVCRE